MEEVVGRGLCPVIALLNSSTVDEICGRNALSLADTLAPFCLVQAVTKDPTGQSISLKLRVDIRDLRRTGFLLSHTVLPSVLSEIVAEVASTSSADDRAPAWSAFRDSLLFWAEPAEHEYLRSYLACIFAVSTRDADPMAELNALLTAQHAQQHGAGDSSLTTPAYCAQPRWFFPNLLKYYILVHDVSTGNDERANELFTLMSTNYGAPFCHLLRINSGAPTGTDRLPDPWALEISTRYRGLQRGLDSARRNLLSKTGQLEANTLTPEAYSATVNGGGHNGSIVFAHGNLLDAGDRERLQKCVEEFILSVLIPHAEKQMRTLNEQLATRRGISKSLTTGVRKWFGSSPQLGAMAVGNAGTANITYSYESPEMQTRRLADLAFLFGLFPFALQMYQTVRKDFATDQAWLYNAGALEMAALCSYLQTPTASKQYPQHYMENALNYYVMSRPGLAMRSAVLSAEISISLGLFLEAAVQLVRLTVSENDLFSALILDRVCICYDKLNMRRKMAFYLVLAGHRFHKAGMAILAKGCYQQALPFFEGKRWQFAEDHILYTLSSEFASADIKQAVAYSERLLRFESAQHEDQQQIFLDQYLRYLRQNPTGHLPKFPVPIIDSEATRVTYGLCPPLMNAEFNGNDDTMSASSVTWLELERLAWTTVTNRPAHSFRHLSLTADSSTNNTQPQQTPLGEPFRVTLKVRNPLQIVLHLRRLRLGLDQSVPSHQIEHTEIAELSIAPDSVTVFELSVIPRAIDGSLIRVRHLIFEIYGSDGQSVTGYVPLEIRGARVTPQHQPEYKADERLAAIPTNHEWPLLTVNYHGSNFQPATVISAYQDQIIPLEFDIYNAGTVLVNQFCLVTDSPAAISIVPTKSVEETDTVVQLSRHFTNERSAAGYVTYSSGQQWQLGSQRRLRLLLRAIGPVPNGNMPDSLDTAEIAVEQPVQTIALLFYYSSANGDHRYHCQTIRYTYRSLLGVDYRILNPAANLATICLRNLVATRDTVLARIELQRLRWICGNDCPAGGVRLSAVTKNPVQLECEYTQNYCFYATPADSAATEEDSIIRLGILDALIIPWPFLIGNPSMISTGPSLTRLPLTGSGAIGRGLSPHPSARNSPSPGPAETIATNYGSNVSSRLGILWRSSIINADGSVSQAETIIDVKPPFASFLYQQNSTWPLQQLPAHMTTIQPPVIAVFANVRPPPQPVYHDFSQRRLCTIPFAVQIANHNLNNPNKPTTVIVENRDGVQLPATIGIIAGLIGKTRHSLQLTAGSHQMVQLNLLITGPGVFDLAAVVAVTVRLPESSNAKIEPVGSVSIQLASAHLTVFDSRFAR